MRGLILAFLLLAGCPSPVPVPIPVDPPQPTPTPTPPEPVPQPTVGAITEEQYAKVKADFHPPVAEVTDFLGPPFRSHEAAGFTVMTYVLPTRNAFFWIKDGKLDHKGTDR